MSTKGVKNISRIGLDKHVLSTLNAKEVTNICNPIKNLK